MPRKKKKLETDLASVSQVQKRRRLNALNTVVSLLREQIKIPSMIGSATTAASTTQPQAKSAPEATMLTAASVEGTKVHLCAPTHMKSHQIKYLLTLQSFIS